MLPFVVFLFCLFMVYGAYLLATSKSEARRERLQKRLMNALMQSASSEDPEVQLARAELLSEIPVLNRFLMQAQVGLRLKHLIDQADLQITVTRLVMLSAMAGITAGLAISVVTISYALIVVVGLMAAGVPFMHVMWVRRKRLNSFLSLLPDALELMSRSLAAGHSFAESLNMVSQEMPEPIATEFRKAYEEQNLGLSLKLALENLANRIPLLDLKLCITAIMIQRETGGNLAEILEKVSHTIRERFRIMEDLNTLTTSSRMSAWILCGLPIFIAMVTTILNPDYMSVLWTDPRGHKLIAAGLFMQISGMLVIRKILNIKV
jgi:tight adherence protein B